MYRHIGAGEAGVPAVRFPADGDRLGRAFYRAVEVDTDAPNLGETEETAVQGGPVAIPGIGQTVVALTPVETRIAGRLPIPHALKERLKRAVNTQHDILQDLAVDLC